VTRVDEYDDNDDGEYKGTIVTVCDENKTGGQPVMTAAVSWLRTNTHTCVLSRKRFLRSKQIVCLAVELCAHLSVSLLGRICLGSQSVDALRSRDPSSTRSIDLHA